MSILSVPLEINGAIIFVGFAVSGPRQAAMRAAGLPIPPAIVVRGLLDTGASCTCVDPVVVKRLGLSPSGVATVHTPSTGTTPHTCNQFDVAIALVMDANQIHVPSVIVPVIESELAGQGIHALIGRDVIDQGIMIYDGRRRHLTLAF